MYVYLLRREETSVWWARLQPALQQQEQDSMGGKCSPAALADLVTPWGVLPRLLLSKREAIADAHSLATGRMFCGSGPTTLGIAPHEISWLASKTPELLKPLQQARLHHLCQPHCSAPARFCMPGKKVISSLLDSKGRVSRVRCLRSRSASLVAVGSHISQLQRDSNTAYITQDFRRAQIQGFFGWGWTNKLNW